MEKESSILMENEKQANIIAAKVMRITFYIFTLVYLLNVIGIFIVDMKVMTIAYVLGTILLWCPTLLVNGLKKQGAGIKYINTICAVLFVTVTTITLTYHVVVVYIYGVAIASLYFSRRLNVMATIMTIIGTSAGQLLGFVLDTWLDKNFPTMMEVVVYGIIPRSLILIAVAAIFTMLTSRTATLLSNLLGAEEQEKVLNHMTRMQEKSTETAEHLLSMVEELSVITESSKEANGRIVKETEFMRQGFAENTKEIGNMNERIQDITRQLTQLGDMNDEVADMAEQVREHTKENQVRMDFATGSMEKIHSSTDECKQVIRNLGEESKEILGIIETITNISSQTNILALNATIEAARAGEHGKGFAVVAEEIQRLSEQTKTAVDDIAEIINQVVHNTDEAVSAMEQSAGLTQKGMDSISEAGNSAAVITTFNTKMSGQIISMDKIAEEVRDKSGEVSKGMEQVSQNTQQNYNVIEQVTEATQKNREGTECIAQMVEQIRTLAGELRMVVQE